MAALAILFRIACAITAKEVYFSLSITFLTTAYHLLMRLAVGEAVTLLYRNREFPYDSPWFQQRSFEPRLYQWLGVKKWKLHLITAKPEQFDIHRLTYGELRKNMTQAEVVHEVIMVLSFAPLMLIPRYGAAVVFSVTSVLACLVDGLFVMIQRFNRPRVLRLKEKAEKRLVNDCSIPGEKSS